MNNTATTLRGRPHVFIGPMAKDVVIADPRPPTALALAHTCLGFRVQGFRVGV